MNMFVYDDICLHLRDLVWTADDYLAMSIDNADTGSFVRLPGEADRYVSF